MNVFEEELRVLVPRAPNIAIRKFCNTLLVILTKLYFSCITYVGLWYKILEVSYFYFKCPVLYSVI